MSNKFTEEQYQKIVNAWDFGESYTESTAAVISYVVRQNIEVACMGDEAIALANPVTRELAHEQYVGEEKKYVWTSKHTDDDGDFARLYNGGSGMISTYPCSKVNNNNNIHREEQLSESEIRKWGYNPDMFYKEEVED